MVAGEIDIHSGEIDEETILFAHVLGKGYTNMQDYFTAMG